MQKEAPWKYIGLDESNNGRYPVIYVAAFSNHKTDTNISKRKRRGKIRNGHDKDRKGHRKISTMLKSRDHSFLFYSRSDNELIKPYKKIGIILASLIYEQPRDDFLKILIDGEWGKRIVDFTRTILHDTTGLEKDCIEIVTSAQLDRKNKLVNIADEMAHWLYRKSLSNIVDNEKRKELLYDELGDYI